MKKEKKKKQTLYPFFILILISLSSNIALGATINVPAHYATIQAGVDAAADGDIVLVADGVYTGDGNKNIGFSGKVITVQSENGPQNCIIDCEGDGSGFNSISTGSVISGFTIRNGYSSRGAAIYCGYSNSTIDNCILINNTATGLGGAVYSQGDTILTGCIIEGNTAGLGAGLYFHDASPIITNCKISNNYTSGDSAYKHGGGIYCSYFSSAPIITNCVITDNTAGGFGGGIYLDSFTLPVIINTTISRNTSQKGGGIYCESDAVTIKNSIIWENTPSELFIHTDCEQNISYCAIKGGFPGETNFHADPLFVDPGNGNYQLDPKSPCLYAGTSEGAPDTDIKGTTRPQGYGYDLGAYENEFSGQRPVIDSFTADMENGMVPHEVTFTCLAHAVDSGAMIQQFTIDFGDGSVPETNTSGIFSHSYSNVGIFHVTCTVEDNQGNIVLSRSVNVHAAGTIHVPSEYPTIQAAIDVAFEGCTILIADGTYSGAGNSNLVLSEKTVVIKSKNGPGSCIIDCQGSGRGFLIENGDRSIISGITIRNGNEYYGGGMEVRGASPTIMNCVFENNTATVGGGIYSSNSSPVIEGCVFVNNETVTSGGVMAPYGRTGGGGIALCGEGSATIGNCVFKGNISFYSGGGLYSQIETQIFNCIFDQNQAEGGGGINFFGMAPANVINCTFNGNSSIGYYYGGAIRTEYSSKTIKNCILWQNTPDEINMYGLSGVVTHCNVYGGYEGEGNFYAEPLFADKENGDFRLLTSSPCIDAGTSEGAPDTDIEGTKRPQGYGYDMGAYEIVYSGQRPIIDSFSADTVRNQIPFDSTFTCIAHDPDGDVTTYTIDYGDGSTPESNSTGVFTHTYNSVGPCWAICTVTDNDGTSVNSLPIDILRQGAIHVPLDYPTVQEAIDAAYDGDIVVLADGIYTGDGNKELDFAGKAITVKSENGPENCIIDLENNGRAFILHSSEGPDTVISGLTVRNGNRQGYGGAIYMWNASPTIQNCIFTKNTVYAERNSPARGGAISIRGTSSPNIINCLFYRNQAIGYYEEGYDPEYSYGSAIFCEGESSPNIVNCTIVFNTGDYEAAVYSEQTSPFIGNSIIWGNTPTNISTGNDALWNAQYNDVEGDYPGVGNFHGDPLFMDADNDNYHLSISSPCIYAASGEIAPSEDILGVERPVGIAADIGAYEATGYSTTRPVVNSFSVDQNEGETPFQMIFKCQASDVDGLITAYTMDFGDGSASETNTTGNFSHTYSSGGTFFAHCTVMDNAGIEIKAKSITMKVHEVRKVPSQYPTIQSAIDAAFDEDIVQLADGIYTGEGNKNVNFNGKPLILRSENGPENSIIDCEGEGRGFIFENQEDNSSVVFGISVVNGNENQGGAIYCAYDASPLIRNCILSDNTATYGGAFYVTAVTLENCRIFNNSARYGGGTYFSSQSSYENSISAITDCEFESNTAEDYGGAVYIEDDGNRPISKCTFYRNSAGGSGGGIYTYNGRIDVSRSFFIENSAGSAGAIALGRYGSSVINCVFSKNTANVGGAITGSDTEDFIANCTFYRNTASHIGGAIRTYIYYSDIPILLNNIFWENSPNHIQADGQYEPDVTYSCVQGGYPGEGNFHGNPLFVDPENLDFHLQTNSPCMYAGTSEGAPDIDFEGNPRPQGYGYDVGAYETNGYDKNRPIIDSFSSDKIEGDLPFDVSFSGSAHDTDGTIVSYTIDYGDGTPPETNQTGDFVHTYTSIGYGDAILTVTDDSGAATNSHSILVKRYGDVHVPSEYPTIQSAVDALLDGNTIVVEDGIYTGEGNTNINVYGKSLTIKSLNGPVNTIIDCQGTGRGFIFENGETEKTVISGFTIINGNGDAETTDTFGRYRGGGIYCYGASPTIDNCIFKGNTAENGGGFYCDESSPIITNCLFLENTSSYGGGGLHFRSSTVSMTNCIVRKNTSDSYGGGVHSSYTGTNTSITNCIIAENSAAYAGGIYVAGFYELCTITNCTITGNSAQNSGGGILCESDLSLDISNSILWNNTPDEIWSSTLNTLTVSYSVVQAGYEGEGNFHGNPLFADPENNDYQLTISSPCIDAGTLTDTPDSDIQGTPRSNGLAPDIGAYEAPDYSDTRPVIESFSSDITEGDIPFTIVFTCSAHDPDGQIVSYTMDYGDGSPPETNTSGVFSYTYTTASSGYATCSVLDNDGISVNSKSIILKRYGVIKVPSEYQTIQGAIDAQFENGIIHVADGTYTGEGNKNIDFKGKALTLLSENGPLNTVIDCEGEGTGFIFQNDEGEDTVVSGFSITGGSGYKYSNMPPSGGGIYCRNASPSIDNCIIYGNTATYGGGIYSDYYSTPKITRCVILGNIANNGGGLYCNHSSSLWITDCLIYSNGAQERGGGIYSSESDPKIVNCTIVYNISRFRGGGIYCVSYSSVTINNTTISENYSLENDAGGIFCYYYSSLNITNSILWGDSPDEIGLSYESDAVIAYSLIQGGWNEGTNILDTDPLFGSGFHLQAGSPCRNAGDPSSASPQFPEHDIDGEGRPQGNNYDIGSDEFYDSDGDYIPDYWEYVWFGDLSHDESTNSDADTLTDLEEFQNATDPFDPDSDNDELSDSVEVDLCTNPNDVDTDDDGIIDGGEDANKNGIIDPDETNPCEVDTDDDGIQDGTENGLTLGDTGQDTDTNIFQPDLDPSSTTDPLKDDTDDDGISDGIEDSNHNGIVDTGETDPCDSDSDNDGLNDGQEDVNHNGLVDPGETNPRYTDTDNDGMPDGWEVENCLDPLIDDTDEDADGDGYSNLQEYASGNSPNDNSDYPSPPFANAGPDQIVDEGTIVTLDGSNSSDPDDDIASYQWEQTGGTSVTLSDSTAISPTFKTPDIGPDGDSLIFQLTVTDNAGLQSIATCIVDVTWVYQPPVAYDQTVETDEDNPLEITLSAGSDIGEESLTYFVVDQVANGVLTGDTPNLVYTPFADYYGSDSFTFKVNDGQNDSNVATIDINVISTVGDIDDNGIIDLRDAVLAMQVCTNTETDADIFTKEDVNGDGRIGVEEVIFVLREIAGMGEE